MTHHPIRDASIHVFAGIGEAEGRFVARLHPYDRYPIIFHGTSEDGVRDEAESFRADAVSKHEAAFINRAEATHKARATRAAKKAVGAGYSAPGPTERNER